MAFKNITLMLLSQSSFRAVQSENFNIIKEIPVVDCFLERLGKEGFDNLFLSGIVSVQLLFQKSSILGCRFHLFV